MKKLAILVALSMFCFTFAYSQEESAPISSGPMYPSAGSIAVGIEASPILRYIGNAFNSSTNNNPRDYWGNQDWHIMMRYYLMDDLAVRAGVKVSGVSNAKTIREVPDQASLLKNPLSNAKVEDQVSVNSSTMEFRLGVMKLRGRDRLRGFFGGSLFYEFQSSSSTYTYGNQMNEVNQNPITSDFSSSSFHESRRTLRKDDGVINRFGFDGFTGVEYYVLPQMSLGFEVGLKFAATIRGKGSERYEKMDGSTRKEYFESTSDRQGSDVSFSTKNPFYGNFYFMFHF